MCIVQRIFGVVVIVIVVFAACPRAVLADRPVTLSIDTPLSPPAWALLERELLEANTAACREFFEKYFDERGWLLCVERCGGRRRTR